MNDLTHLSTEELSTKLDELDRNLLASSDHLDTVQVASYNLAREIKQKELELDEYKQAAKKARSIISKLNTERDITERAYFRSLRQDKFKIGG